MENQTNLTKPGRNLLPWDDRDRNWQKWRKKQKKIPKTETEKIMDENDSLQLP